MSLSVPTINDSINQSINSLFCKQKYLAKKDKYITYSYELAFKETLNMNI